MTQSNAPARGHAAAPAAPAAPGFTVEVTPAEGTMQVEQYHGTRYDVKITNNTGIDGLFMIEVLTPNAMTPLSVVGLADVKWISEQGELHFEHPGRIVVGHTRDHTIVIRAHATRGLLPPGDYPFTVRVSVVPTRAGAPDASQGSADAQGVQVDPTLLQPKTVDVMLHVVAYSWCQLNLIPLNQPIGIGDNVTYSISLNNRGNIAARFRLSAREGQPANVEEINPPFIVPDETGLLDFRFNPEEVVVGAGGGAGANVVVRLTRTPSDGQEKDIPFTIDAVPLNPLAGGSYIVRTATGAAGYTSNPPLAVEVTDEAEQAPLSLRVTLFLIAIGLAALVVVWLLLVVVRPG